MDLSEFEELSTKKLLPCKVAIALEQLTEEERNLFAAACSNREKVSTGALAKWLTNRGHIINASMAVHHRAGTCSCGRS